MHEITFSTEDKPKLLSQVLAIADPEREILHVYMELFLAAFLYAMVHRNMQLWLLQMSLLITYLDGCFAL